MALTRLIEALDVDLRTKHFICGEPSAVVGALRLTADFLPGSILTGVAGSTSDGSCLLSRLVVDAGHRNRGIAKRLELAAIDYAAERGQRVAWVEATPTTAEPLGRIGFEIVGSYFENTAIFVRQHITIMRRELGR